VEAVPTPGTTRFLYRYFPEITDLMRKKAVSLDGREKAQKKGQSPVFMKNDGQPATAMGEKPQGNIFVEDTGWFFGENQGKLPPDN
jgi:hypothetical protein